MVPPSCRRTRGLARSIAGREQVAVRLDVARQHLKLDVTLVIDTEDLGDRRISVTAADDDVAASDRYEPRPRVSEAGPHAAVVAHVHEVDGDVVMLVHDDLQEWAHMPRVISLMPRTTAM